MKDWQRAVHHLDDDNIGVFKSKSAVGFLLRGKVVFGVKSRIVIPPRAETGAWFVSRLIIVDKADNWLDAPFTAATVPAGGTLNVPSADSDSTPPDVRNAWLEKGTVYDGESNTITIQIDDDRSEVAWVLGSFKSRTTGALVPFNCSAGPVAGIWQGAIQAPSSADCGEWRLFALRFADTAGNVGEMVEGSRLLPRVVFVRREQPVRFEPADPRIAQPFAYCRIERQRDGCPDRRHGL